MPRFTDNEEQFASWLRSFIGDLSSRLSDFGITADQVTGLEEAARKLSDAIAYRREKQRALEASQKELEDSRTRVQVAENDLKRAQEAARRAVIEANDFVDPLAESLYHNPKVSDRFLKIHGFEQPTAVRTPLPLHLKATATKGINVISWSDGDRKPNTSYIVEVTYGNWYRGSPQPPVPDRDRRETFPATRAEFRHNVASLRAQTIVRYRVIARDAAGGDRVSNEVDLRCT
jgi:hypothetical protein